MASLPPSSPPPSPPPALSSSSFELRDFKYNAAGELVEIQRVVKDLSDSLVPLHLSSNEASESLYDEVQKAHDSAFKNFAKTREMYNDQNSTVVRIRVASYNVLSSCLSSPSHFVGVENPEWCDPKYRLELIKEKLESEFTKNSVICLQEVSLEWAGKLQVFFEANNYAFVVSNYGNVWNGYMGVGIAYPRECYVLQEVDVTCISDTKTWSASAPAPATAVSTTSTTSTTMTTMTMTTRKLFTSLYAMLIARFNVWSFSFKKKESQPENPWEIAKSRFNRMVSLRLRPIRYGISQHDFWVSTYHMPCVFKIPAVMTIHTALAIQHVYKLSGNGKFPRIFAGDFNFKPKSPQYMLVTEAYLSRLVHDPYDLETHGKRTMPDVPCYPGDLWYPRLAGSEGSMFSAYYETNGKEPPFTNLALTKDMKNGKSFAHTLDYVFFCGGAHKMLHPCDTVQLANDELRSLKSLPSQHEPSDHLLIAVDFEMSDVPEMRARAGKVDDV